MAITGPSSYVPTINQFLRHWPRVNVALGASGPLVLTSGASVTSLTGLRDQLEVHADTIHDFLNDEEISRADIGFKKEALALRLGEFNRKVRGFLGQTPYAAALPFVPSMTSGQAAFTEPLDDMISLWGKINAATIPGFTGPLTLLGGYDLATFTTEVAALKAAYTTWQAVEQDLALERQRRNATQDQAYIIMRDYRAAVGGLFDTKDSLVNTLPKLSPEPGSTPVEVIVSIVWDEDLQQARITWIASTDPNLSHYDIRFNEGPNYLAETETTIGSVEPGNPLEFLTTVGLTTPGATASFKVYVVLTTGNEKGSNAVTITRP